MRGLDLATQSARRKIRWAPWIIVIIVGPGLVTSDLADFLESIPLDEIEEDHRGHVVTFRISFDKPRIGNALIVQPPERGHHVPSGREPALGARGLREFV